MQFIQKLSQLLSQIFISFFDPSAVVRPQGQNRFRRHDFKGARHVREAIHAGLALRVRSNSDRLLFSGQSGPVQRALVLGGEPYQFGGELVRGWLL
jgi:hypothetical protein